MSPEKKNRLIWIAAEPWDETNFARPQQIPLLLADRGWTVDYVVAGPSWLRQIRRKSEDDWTIKRTSNDGLSVRYLSAPLPGAHRFSIARAFNAHVLRQQMKSMSSMENWNNPLYVVNSPALLEFWPPDSRLVYDCHDDIRTFSWTTPAYKRVESSIFSRASAVVFSAAPLLDRYASRCRRAVLIRNGCHPEDFMVEPTTAIPEDLQEIPEPRVGFHGLLGHWLDYDLIGAAARKTPEAHWVFIGRSEVAPDVLPKADNIHYLGKRPYEQLGRYMNGFRAMVLPFQVNRLTEAVNPVKVYEYLAGGKPVVSTPMPEVLELAEAGLVDICDHAGSFAQSIMKALHTPVEEMDREKRMRFAQTQSWEHRVDLYESLLREVLRGA
jgi:glycosyltransferase involved in cell wall biosynthesis